MNTSVSGISVKEDIESPPSVITFVAKACEVIVKHIPTAKDIYVYEGDTIKVDCASGVRPFTDIVKLDFVNKYYGIPVKGAYIEEFIKRFVEDDAGKEQFTSQSKWRALDRTIRLSTGQRLRVSMLQHQGGKLGLVIRVIPMYIEKLDESTQLPPAVLGRLQNPSGGFVIICGPTGSGKTQVAVSIADHYNNTYSGHIEMIEDPTEQILVGKRCVITQRQVGIDVPSYAEGMIQAKRHNPSFVMAGEIRDRDTAEASINMAESGAYMLATNHANTIAAMLRTLSGLASSGSSSANIETVHKMLAGSVTAVVRTALLKSADGTVYFRVYDTMLNEGRVTQALATGNLLAIDAMIAEVESKGECTSMNTAIIGLVKAGKVDKAEALAKTSNYAGLRAMLA